MLAKVIRATGAAHIGDAVRYIARDRPDQAGEPRPEMWTHGFDCPLDERGDRETAIDIMRAQARASGRRRPKPYHVVLTWQSGEHPTREQAERAAEHVMDRLGYAGCPAVAAMHRDTDNDHLHLVVCRVDESGRIHAVPHHDYLLLDRAMREIEIEQKCARSQGPWITLDTQEGPQIVRMSRRERRSRGLLKDRGEQPGPGPETVRIETATGDLSFQSWVTGEPAAALHAAVERDGATWEDAHRALAEYGLTIQRKGSGLVVTTTVPSPTAAPRVLAAKASTLGRWASKSALEKRLGEFTPPADLLPPPASGRTYAEAVAAHRVDLDSEVPPRDEGTERTAGREGDRQQAGGAHEQDHQRQSHGSQSRQQQDHSQAGQRRGARDQEERTRRRAERQAERDALAQRFAAGEAERSAAAKKRREELRARHAAERANLRERLKTERAAARTEMRSQGIDTRTADALFAFKAAAAREQMTKRQRDERQALSAELSRGMVWRRWVESQAAAGDEPAQAALRGILYRERRRRRAETNGIEGDAVDPLEALHERLRKGPDDLVLATLSAERDKRGQYITYRRTATGATAFVDRGPRIDMLSQENAALEAALRIASEKYGGRVLLTGSAEFQERAARMAARLGIRVTNSDLQGVVRDAQQQPYDHRAWATASQRAREEREREHREAVDRERRAAQEHQPPEQPQSEAGSAAPRQPDPPIIERADPPRHQAVEWWNRRTVAERAAWMAEAAAAGRERTLAGAWHRWRDYQDAGHEPPAAVRAVRERGDRRGARRGRDEER
jgi:hypothetical protein